MSGAAGNGPASGPASDTGGPASGPAISTGGPARGDASGRAAADTQVRAWARRARAFTALQRLSGWTTYAQLAEAAAWLREWQSQPPISSRLPGEPDDAGPLEPDGPTEADAPEPSSALRGRLQDVEARVERRCHRVFGFRSFDDWVAQVVPRLVASELAVAAGLPPTSAQTMVNVCEALFLDDRLPRLRRLLSAGWVDWPKVRLFVWETASLDAEVARAVESVVLGPLPGDEELAGIEVVDVLADPAAPGSGVPVIARWTLPELKAAIRAAVLEIDAAAAERRAARARAGRHVRATENDDGTADVVANLPAEDAAAVFASLDAAARAAKRLGDPRTLDQLRADELVHRATRGVTAAEKETHTGQGSPAATEESARSGGATDPHPRPHFEMRADMDPDMDPDVHPERDSEMPAGDGFRAAGDTDASSHAYVRTGMQRCACGRDVPVSYVPSLTAELAGPPTKSTLVSLTMSLSTFLGLADQPGLLDGHGPVAAGLARRIAADAARDQPEWTTWRCIVTDDVHGTVLGVTDPVWTPRHDPPERLSRLVTAMTPTCAFPGCRTAARRCDLDHRIPYDPDDPDGARGGGRTCSCNLGSLCRNHHQQKTSGALKVREVSRDEDSTTPFGTLVWTLPSGTTCRTHPYVASPVPVVGPRRTPAPDVQADVAAAVQHLADRQARHDSWQQQRLAERADSDRPESGRDDTDWVGEAWYQSRVDAARRRTEQAAAAHKAAACAVEPPPF